MKAVVCNPMVCEQCRAGGHTLPCPIPMDDAALKVAARRRERQEAIVASLRCPVCGNDESGTLDIIKRCATCDKCGARFDFDGNVLSAPMPEGKVLSFAARS